MGANILAVPAFLPVVMALKSAWAGLLAGCLHTLTGPDHLAALTPLTIGPNRAQNALMGALWGCGHNTGQIIFGLIFILLRDRLPFNMELISQYGQGIVGLTLVIIGCLGFLESLGHGHGHSHSHGHSHGGHSHSHSHSHGGADEGGAAVSAEGGGAAALDVEAMRKKRQNTGAVWTYITGTIHGLQPDALLLLLPAFALPKVQAIAFLSTFFIGTVVAMGTYTWCIGGASAMLGKHNPKMTTLVSKVSSAVALVIGVLFVASAAFGLEIF